MSTKMVRVFNDNSHPLKTFHKGDPIEIGPKAYLLGPDGKPMVLDIYEANDLRCSYHPIVRLASGEQDPKTFKIIRLEPVDGAAVENEVGSQADPHVCMRCQHKSPSAEELDAHVNARHATDARLTLPEEDAKPKRGRPPKEQKSA